MCYAAGYRRVPVNDDKEEPYKYWLFDTVTMQFIAEVEYPLQVIALTY